MEALCWAASLNPLKQTVLADDESSLPADYGASPPVMYHGFTMTIDSVDPGIKPDTLEQLDKFMEDSGISPTRPCAVSNNNPPPDFEAAVAAYTQPYSAKEKRARKEDARLSACYEQRLLTGSTLSSSSKILRKEHKAYLRHTGRSLFIIGQSPSQSNENKS